MTDTKTRESTKFEVLLLAEEQVRNVEIQYSTEDEQVARAWVDEWNREGLGFVAVVVPSRRRE